MQKILEKFKLQPVEPVRLSGNSNKRHKQFFKEFEKAVKGKATNRDFLADYLSHTPKLELGEYLENIQLNGDPQVYDDDYDEFMITNDFIDLSMQYLQFLLKHFDREPVLEFYIDKFLHVNSKERLSVGHFSTNWCYDEHIAINLHALSQVTTDFKIGRAKMLGYFNEYLEENLKASDYTLVNHKLVIVDKDENEKNMLEAVQYVMDVYALQDTDLQGFRKQLTSATALRLLDNFEIRTERSQLETNMQDNLQKKMMKL